MKKELYGFWKIKFRQWDNLLHSLLCAIENAKVEAMETKIPFSQTLLTELNCDADLRKKSATWPKLILQIIKHSIPPKARSICRKFVLSMSR